MRTPNNCKGCDKELNFDDGQFCQECFLWIRRYWDFDPDKQFVHNGKLYMLTEDLGFRNTFGQRKYFIRFTDRTVIAGKLNDLGHIRGRLTELFSTQNKVVQFMTI